MTNEIEALLAEFWERREGGESIDANEFAAAHPQHEASLRAALARLLRTADLLPEGDSPARIGGYHVEHRLGRGATGEVFAVRDASGRPLALKRLLPHAAATPRARERLQREAHVLRDLRHPGIVGIVDVGEHEGRPFLVMERVGGEPLSAWIANARTLGRDEAAGQLAGPGTSWQRLARLGAAVAEAVAAAHEHGVLHRDLKPSNVLLRGDGAPVVVDFGLAADAEAATLTGTGDVIGTPHYMAPEQARGETSTERSDIYAIGAILLEALTLVPPRAGSDVVAVLDAARHGVVPGPRRVDAGVPRELDLIVRRAMAFRPRHRHATAAELASALRFVADGGRPIGLTLSAGLRIDEFWRRRKRAVVAVGATCIVLVGALIVHDTFAAARSERQRAALLAATEAHLDGATAEAAAAADVVAEDDRVLAGFLRGDDASGDADEFVAALRDGQRALAKDARAAMKAFDRAVALRPASSLAVAWLGLAAVKARAFDVAERELTSAVRALPSSVRLRTELALVLRSDGVLKTAEGVSHLQHAVTLPRAGAEAWHQLTKALTKDKQYEPALRAIDTALSMATSDQRTGMLRAKAVVFDALKRHDEAIPLLRSILDVAPTADTWVSYGTALDSTHRLRDAATAYRGALAIDRKHAPALTNLVYLFTGSDREKCTRCRECFEKDPQLLDVKTAEDFAIELLSAQEGRFGSIETVAGYLRRVGAGQRLVIAIDERLERDLAAEPLGRLMRAKKVLAPK